MDKLPELNPRQMQILQKVHAYWRENRRFPKTVVLSVPMRREMDVKAVLKTIPYQLLARDKSDSPDDEVLRLQILGLALCPSEKRIVEAFLELVRRAARKTIENPSVRIEITHEDLRDILHDLPNEEFDLVSPIVREGLRWGGSYGPKGGWKMGPSLDVIRYEGVASVNDYLRLGNIEPRHIAVLQDEHIALMREVWQYWHEFDRWPMGPEFIVNYRSKGDAILLLNEIPNRYLREGSWSHDRDTKIKLTLDGIAATGVAEDDLAAFVKIITVLIPIYESSPEDATVTIREISDKANLPEAVVLRLSEVVANEWMLGVGLYRSETSWQFTLRERILEFEGIQTFLEYLAKREDIQMRQRMPEDELDDSAIRRGILGLFDHLKAYGPKSLNRTNILGRPYQPGDFERYLNRTLTLEERARAGRLMKELESEGLLVPTYRDIANPEDWLIITDHGQRALAEPLPSTTGEVVGAVKSPGDEFDAFLCHASEDKGAVVLPFAETMKTAGLHPWLDSSEVTWGDRLVERIEYGLTRSRFVIVFISNAFLRKEWPERELQAALSMEIGGRKKVLPVVLGIDHNDLQKHHPFIADKLYMNLPVYDLPQPVSAKDLHRILEALREVLEEEKN